MKKMLLLPLLLLLGSFGLPADREIFRDDFSANKLGANLPRGHRQFFATKVPKDKQKDIDYKMKMAAAPGGGKEFVMIDNDDQTGIGIVNTIPGEAGKTYRLTVKARPVDDQSLKFFMIQIRSNPSGKLEQVNIATPAEGEKYSATSVKITLQPTDDKITYYVYSQYPAAQAVAVREIKVEEVEETAPAG